MLIGSVQSLAPSSCHPRGAWVLPQASQVEALASAPGETESVLRVVRIDRAETLPSRPLGILAPHWMCSLEATRACFSWARAWVRVSGITSWSFSLIQVEEGSDSAQAWGHLLLQHLSRKRVFPSRAPDLEANCSGWERELRLRNLNRESSWLSMCLLQLPPRSHGTSSEVTHTGKRPLVCPWE